MQTCKQGTWIEPEERCYPNGAMVRKARVLLPDGTLRMVRAGIPDTFFSIPARIRIAGKTVRGFIYAEDDTLRFHSRATEPRWKLSYSPEDHGWLWSLVDPLHPERDSFGLLPTDKRNPAEVIPMLASLVTGSVPDYAAWYREEIGSDAHLWAGSK